MSAKKALTVLKEKSAKLLEIYKLIVFDIGLCYNVGNILEFKIEMSVICIVGLKQILYTNDVFVF